MAPQETDGQSLQPDIALEAHELTYQVDAARLIDSVSLSATRGEFVGLIGPNGAGKSTLLRAVSGLLRAQEGAVSLEGRDLADLTAQEVARLLAQVPQTPPTTYGFTSAEVVLMGRYPHMGRFQVEREEDREVALDAMRFTETDSFANRPVATLSGGERQRVFIARALAQQPRILLLDEPTANLDIQHQLKVLELVGQLSSQGMTTIAAIHDLSLAARYCQRLVLMHNGRILADGAPEAVLTPANIEEAFGVCAIVYRDPVANHVSVSPIDHTNGSAIPGIPSSNRIHLVCGGGAGVRLMYTLQQSGVTVTAGVLGAGDTDRAAADALGVEYVPVPAFSPIDDVAHNNHLDLVRKADLTILCDMPIGPHNMRNLQAVAEAERIISFEQTPLTERDYTGGDAARFIDTLDLSGRTQTIDATLSAIRALLIVPPGANVHQIG